jgi:ADP-ribose pyrophosphatase
VGAPDPETPGESRDPRGTVSLHPGDEGLFEARVSGRHAWSGGFLKIYDDTVRLPDGATTSREYIVHPGAVVIVPFLDDGRLVVERQYRYPVGQAILEFPAGKIDPGEPTFDCARRELAEETGYTAREWATPGRIHNAPAYSTEFLEIWFARGLTAGPRQLDPHEHLDVLAMDLDTLLALAARGALTDAKTLIALLWLQNLRAGAWTLDWKAAY